MMHGHTHIKNTESLTKLIQGSWILFQYSNITFLKVTIIIKCLKLFKAVFPKFFCSQNPFASKITTDFHIFAHVIIERRMVGA
jgi:hypothetical protein